MTEETVAAQATEAPAPADNANEAASQTTTDPAETPVEPPEETVEIERDGKRYAVPKKLEAELMMRQDYTRKTQEVAEQRKAFEAERESTLKAVEREREMVKANREFAATLQQLEEYSAITPEAWSAYGQSDPNAAQAAFIKMQSLKDKAARLGAAIQQDEARKAFESQQSTARQLEQAVQELRTAIPDWSDTKATELLKYATKLGASEDSARRVREPWIVKALHKAAMFDQSMKSATAAPATPAAPIRTIGSQARAAVDPDKMSIADWMKWDDQQQAKKRRS